jgi:hypothetical protein
MMFLEPSVTNYYLHHMLRDINQFNLIIIVLSISCGWIPL